MTLERAAEDRGVALVTTLLVLMLMSALMIGFSAAVMGDQRYRSLDKDRIRAFYAAQSGLEKLSADLANLFFLNVAPTPAEIAALGEEEDEPNIPGVTFDTPLGEAYGVTPIGGDAGETYAMVSSGPYQGLYALKRSYRLDSAVRTSTGGEAHVTRDVETVAIPVFQFGMFSDVDLSFHAGANFNFGGRIHTNSNLFLAQGGGAGTTLTMPQKVTAVGEVVRKFLVNGSAITDSGHTRDVRVAKSTGATRVLATNEGSVVDSVGSARNDPTWTNVSLTHHNGFIRNGRTGAKALNLPVVMLGASNADIVRRPAHDEDTTNPTLLAERFYTKVSLRILLSDTAADITSLPGVTATAPVSLENFQATPPPGYVVGPGRPPIARSVGPAPAGLRVDGAVAAGSDRTIQLDGVNVPAFYRHEVLNVIVGGVNAGTVTCTGKRQNRFTGCTSALPKIFAGSTIASTVDTTEGDNQPVSTTVTAQWSAAGADLFVTSTMNFAPNTFWVRNGDNENVLVTCRGYTATNQFRECNVPAALDDNAQILSQALTPRGTGLIGGFIKIEMQDTDLMWRDVTSEILGYGIADRDLTGSCADPTPNAIVRLQRLRDNVEPAGSCSYANSERAGDYWPNTLFDPREALYRDVSPGKYNLKLGGVMHYVTLDVRNLSRWFAGTVAPYDAGSGRQALSRNGYSVYFSDRRNNRDAANQETGEFGWEDVINPGAAGGAPNATLDPGEDVNASGALDSYGQLPSFAGVRNSVPMGSVAPLTTAARLTDNIQRGHAQVNRAIFFRRALKLVNGASGIVTPGLTISAENPVYVQGDWNAVGGFDGAHAATAIIADSVTVLSNTWNDNISYLEPYDPGARPRSATSWYRFAVIAGKNAPFPRSLVVGASEADFGTDGGAHNFLRMLEGGGGTVNYRGSMATFYFSRQAVGVYKCCATVYSAPTRVFNFDSDFLSASKLPPLTPVFRDVNARGFTQEIRPGR